jgi:hypothetical protein
MRIQIALIAVAALFAGCSPMVETGKPIVVPKEKDATLFGVNEVAQTSMTNQSGKPVAGLILRDASLIKTARELASSKHQRYVIFCDFLMGNGVEGSYWRQQSERRVGLDLPVMDTRATKVILVTVNSDQVVMEWKSVRAAHVQISVDTNDFARSFTP